MDDDQRREARAWARQLVADWPPLSDQQLARLRRILRGPRTTQPPARQATSQPATTSDKPPERG